MTPTNLLGEPPDHFQFFATLVEDPRVRGRCDHLLVDILFISFCALLCGAESFVEIENFGNAKLEWLEQFLELRNGIPSHDTFRRIFILLDPSKLEKAFFDWVNKLNPERSRIIALDGKAVRGTERFSNQDKRPLQIVNAFCPDSGLVLGQRKASGSGLSENSAVLDCLETLDIKDALITADAGSANYKVFQKIREKGAHYLIPIKGNQRVLRDIIDRFFSRFDEGKTVTAVDQFELTETNRDRKEQRTCAVVLMDEICDSPGFKRKFKDLCSVARVVRKRARIDQRGYVVETRADGSSLRRKNENKNQLREQTEATYYITDLKTDAKWILQAARTHWSIENRLHWQLDVSFREDQMRVKNKIAASNLAALRKMAFNVIKKDTSKGSMRGKIQRAAWDNNFLESLIFKPT